MEQFGEIFNIMTRDNSNKMCIDCKKPYPLFASINNGVFLCEACSNIHKSFGSHISYIRHLKDSWDEYLLAYMARGGNQRFLSYMEIFNIQENSTDPFSKYKTKGMEHYRLILRSEVLADEPPEKIDPLKGNQQSEFVDINYFPEFDNYQMMGENYIIEENEDGNKKTSFISKVEFFLKKMGKSVKKAAKNVGDKFKELDIGDKLKAGGKKAYFVMKNAGGFVVMKSKPIMEKISEKTKQGALTLSKKTKELISDIKQKIKGDESKGEVPTSDYYELKSHNANDRILNYIDEKENKSEIILEKGEIDKNIEIHEESSKICNSFSLLNQSNESLNQIEESKYVLPTLKEIEHCENSNLSN